ncbi:MAG: aminotransferase class V-fold PLP-dependent enzyme [Cetobacterium sp.]|uniref:aminotransferase class V-fold PLP-dependent enzyme n=1 Tax=unclassified Cetobacterium TaxID=2630983 RepID=UPI00163C9527|nr:aminotransferase class V-fold PLP-dependent enzyme [Cetobacterium sp. 2A]MBC2856661.1 aminotransferase class V-fold PLP-dependent enzyme [Cetobacterium sp. 2A]
MKSTEHYFDNSATSHPKPETVYDSVNFSIKNLSGNPGRSGHHKSVEINRQIYSVRDKIANFFNISNPLQISFTANATESLNFAIKGCIKDNQRIITSVFEHNSVLRPLFSLRDEHGVKIDFIETFEDLKNNFNRDTKVIVINHISNVTGNIQPLKEIGEFCKKNNLLFIVDASQSAGYINIDVEEMNIDILCFTGHKSLFGIQGVGGIYVREGIEITPILEGGTGSFSKLERQPKVMPELLESGTLNTPGILSLGAGIDFINSVGLETIRNHENKLTSLFLDEISKIDKIKIYSTFSKDRAPVISINISGIPAQDVATILDEEFNILTRAGFHCAPLAHKFLGTDEYGTVRFSFGYFNTEEEIIYTVDALKNIVTNI